MTLEQEIKQRIKRQADGHQSRELKNYTIKQREYPFGIRLYAEPCNEEIYRHVQDSRGFHSDKNTTVESLLKTMEEESFLVEMDQVRYDELCMLNIECQFFSKETGFFEIGFRMPKILKCVGLENFAFAKGCDISRISVQACRKLGYDVREIDLSKEFELYLKHIGLIVCYHTLEHIPNPLTAIKKIYEQADPGTFFHVEVPIEPGMPHLSYAHMHEFQDGDLQKMLEIAGWESIYHTHKTHSDGPFIDRVLVVKR